MSLAIPPAPPRQPLRWRRALAELRALLADPDDTDRAVSLIYAFGGQEFERNFQRFAASPSSRALLAERPSLLATLSERASLAALPAGSLGRAYLAYLDANGFEPEGLIAVQNRVEARWQREHGFPALDPLRAWFRDRTLLSHDLFHLLTGYGTDELGEATLLAFSLAQLGGRGQAFLTLGAALEVVGTLGWRFLAYDFRAWRRGRRAVWLPALPWEELLPLRVETVCRLARVAPASEVHRHGVLRGSPDAHAWAAS